MQPGCATSVTILTALPATPFCIKSENSLSHSLPSGRPLDRPPHPTSRTIHSTAMTQHPSPPICAASSFLPFHRLLHRFLLAEALARITRAKRLPLGRLLAISAQFKLRYASATSVWIPCAPRARKPPIKRDDANCTRSPRWIMRIQKYWA